MKKSVLIFVISLAVIFTVSLWAFNSNSAIELQDIILYSVILIILIFAVAIAISRIKSIKNGEPPEDELSKKIMRKASSFSFYTSIYAWLLLSYVNDKLEFEAHTVIGAGILLMVIIFFGYWAFFKIWGLKNE